MPENQLKHVTLILGGLWGWDGWVSSSGMLILRNMLLKIPGVSVSTYTWNNYPQAVSDLRRIHNWKDLIIIGYSGGGSRATYLVNEYRDPIRLMVLYDPSPSWQMEDIGSNVGLAVNYFNKSPNMPSPFGWLGGGVLRSSVENVVTQTISEQHLAVQFDMSLHQQTVSYVRGL